MAILTEENYDEMKDKGFKTCHNKGFHIRLKNGWTISVQFGVGNYCENYNNPIDEFRLIGKVNYASDNAEVWAWDERDNYYPEEPLGYQTPEDLIKFINKIAKRKPNTNVRNR